MEYAKGYPCLYGLEGETAINVNGTFSENIYLLRQIYRKSVKLSYREFNNSSTLQSVFF